MCLYRFGNCVPYENSDQGIPCGDIYTPGVDHIYVSYRRTGGNIDSYLRVLTESAGLLFAVFQDECHDPATRILCHYYLPPCGNSTIFEPPTSVCMETCNYLRQLCPSVWDDVLAFFEENISIVSTYGTSFINCSNTGEFLDPLPYCCSDAGVDIRMSSALVIACIHA